MPDEKPAQVAAFYFTTRARRRETRLRAWGGRLELRNVVDQHPEYESCGAQWLAYVLLCRRFAVALTGDRARLVVDVDRYSFIVSDLHRLLIAGLPGYCERFWTLPNETAFQAGLAEPLLTGLNWKRGFEQLLDLDHELMLMALFAKPLKVVDNHLLP